MKYKYLNLLNQKCLEKKSIQIFLVWINKQKERINKKAIQKFYLGLNFH
jgi:hypothetical protein